MIYEPTAKARFSLNAGLCLRLKRLCALQARFRLRLMRMFVCALVLLYYTVAELRQT
jgi:hypothetical protein